MRACVRVCVYTDVVGLLLVECDDVSALVGGVGGGGAGAGAVQLERRVVDHRHDRDAQIHAQRVDVEEPEERQHGQHQTARRKLCTHTTVV